MPDLSAGDDKRWGFGRWMACVILFSFIMKIAAGYMLKESFFHRGNSYHALNAIAFNLLDHQQYALQVDIPSVDYEPLYPFILAFAYKVFGKSWLGVTLIQGLLHGFTTWCLYLIGQLVYDRRAGFIGGTYHSFYPFLFLHSLSVVDTTQFIFVIIFLIYWILREEKNSHPQWKYVSAGAIMGVALLSRGSALALLPPIIVFLLLKPSKLKLAIKILLILMSTLAVLSPWLLRNYQYTGAILISTHGSYGVWQGNNLHSYELFKKNISLDEITRLNHPPEIYRKHPLSSRYPKDALKTAAIYKEAALTFIKENPAEFMKLAWIKFVKFWSWIYNPVIKKYSYGDKHIRQLVYFISYFPLLLALPVGLYFLYKRSLLNFILISGLLLFYTLAHMIAMGFSRARLPLDPILMLIFGISASSIYSMVLFKWREKRSSF